jgi:hypothetical protein
MSRNELGQMQETNAEHGDGHKPVQLPLSPEELRTAHSKVKPTKFDYVKALEDFGYTALVDKAYAESRAAGHHFASEGSISPYADISTWREHGCQILASLPRRMLQGILDGSLPTMVEGGEDPDLARYFDKDMPYADQSPWAQRDSELTDQFVPTLYMRAYVDNQGNPPTQDDIELIITHLRQYISGDPRCAQQNASIDSQTRGRTSATEIQQGHHRYLGRQIRAERIETFCKAVDRNLRKHKPDSGSSMSVVNNPFKYFGVTSHPHHRMNQHASQKSTNRIMALVTNIGKYLKSEGSILRSYDTKSYTICHVADEMEYRLSEGLFCRLGGGYYYTGRGFNIAGAGSAGDGDLGETNFREGTEQWARCVEWRMEHTSYLDNMEHELNVDSPKYVLEIKRVMWEKERLRDQRKARQRKRDEITAEIQRMATASRLLDETIAAAIADLRREHELTARSVSHPEHRRLLRLAYASIDRRISAEFEALKRELDGEDDVLVEASSAT